MSNASMRPSRVLARLRAGRVARVMKSNLADPRVTEIIALNGFDCVWTDLEHVPNDMQTIQQQVYAAKAHDVDVLCRVPRGSYSDLVRPLEADCAGIMVPHVMSTAEAREIVRRTRFYPLGLRPADGGNADGAYCAVPIDAYFAQANRERFVVLQIEDPEPLEELDAIASLPGYDVLFFGPGDFSQAIGVPGRMDDPRIADARRRVADTARRHGKFAGTTGSPESLDALTAMGYSLVSLGADVLGLHEYCRRIAAAFGTGEETAPAPGYYGAAQQPDGALRK
jgi:4-hydroxy-2-oxoheptanedioate aldolase